MYWSNMQEQFWCVHVDYHYDGILPWCLTVLAFHSTCSWTYNSICIVITFGDLHGQVSTALHMHMHTHPYSVDTEYTYVWLCNPLFSYDTVTVTS